MFYKFVWSAVVLGMTGAPAFPAGVPAVSESPGGRSPASCLRQARKALASRHFDQAIRQATQAIEQMPGFMPAYAVRGLAYFATDQDYAAIQDFCIAIVGCHTLPEVYVLRGACYLKQKRYAEAVEDADQAIKLNKRCADAYCLRALAYKAQGHTKLAKADYRKWKRYRRNPAGKSQ
jgi:tetratricopeptide (TPR) repeat protein